MQENAERGTEVKGNKPIEAFDLDLDPEIFYYIICKYNGAQEYCPASLE